MVAPRRRTPQRVTLQTAKSLIVELRTELIRRPEIKKFEARVMLEDEEDNILQVHMTGRPPYDVSRVALNGSEIMVYRNTPGGS